MMRSRSGPGYRETPRPNDPHSGFELGGPPVDIRRSRCTTCSSRGRRTRSVDVTLSIANGGRQWRGRASACAKARCALLDARPWTLPALRPSSEWQKALSKGCDARGQRTVDQGFCGHRRNEHQGSPRCAPLRLSRDCHDGIDHDGEEDRRHAEQGDHVERGHVFSGLPAVVANWTRRPPEELGRQCTPWVSTANDRWTGKCSQGVPRIGTTARGTRRRQALLWAPLKEWWRPRRSRYRNAVTHSGRTADAVGHRSDLPAGRPAHPLQRCSAGRSILTLPHAFSVWPLPSTHSGW